MGRLRSFIATQEVEKHLYVRRSLIWASVL
jgi:hypothetical protein